MKSLMLIDSSFSSNPMKVSEESMSKKAKEEGRSGRTVGRRIGLLDAGKIGILIEGRD